MRGGTAAYGAHRAQYHHRPLIIEKELNRLKWNLWHGNVHKALQIVEDLEYDLELEENSQEHRKLLKAVREFGTYIAANRPFIPNYGDRYRHGETISTSFVESAVNQVVEQAHGEETADAVDRPRSFRGRVWGCEGTANSWLPSSFFRRLGPTRMIGRVLVCGAVDLSSGKKLAFR